MKFLYRIKYSMTILIILFSLSVNIHALEKSKVYSYPIETVYSTMIRFIVVNQKGEIIQKDIEGAYIKFKNKKENISGIIEIIKLDSKSSKIVINFDGAHYKLVQFLKKFNKKIEEEKI